MGVRVKLKELGQLLFECSDQVFNELGSGWKEDIYQKAMEVALRSRGLSYETQRILPITFSGHVIGESIPDLVIWLKTGNKKVAVVIDLKTEADIKDEHKRQVQKYIRELKKQIRPGEVVAPFGLVINFIKEQNNSSPKDNLVTTGRIQILKVND